MDITKDDLEKVITSLSDSFDADLFAKQESDLEEYWYFKWDSNKSLELNIYQFHDMLELYGSFCHRWEGKHNGHICIVERVKDKYLMPKIKAFAEIIKTKLDEPADGE